MTALWERDGGQIEMEGYFWKTRRGGQGLPATYLMEGVVWIVDEE